MDLALEAVVPVLDQVARMSASPDPDLRPPPADKIQRNLLSDSVATLLTAGMSRVDLVRKYFKLRHSAQDDIAETLRARYSVLRNEGLAPDDIFVSLQRYYVGGDQVASADRQSAVSLPRFRGLASSANRPTPHRQGKRRGDGLPRHTPRGLEATLGMEDPCRTSASARATEHRP